VDREHTLNLRMIKKEERQHEHARCGRKSKWKGEVPETQGLFWLKHLWGRDCDMSKERIITQEKNKKRWKEFASEKQKCSKEENE